MCIIFEKKKDSWIKVGQTEQIDNSLNPDFKTAIKMTYFFERN